MLYTIFMTKQEFKLHQNIKIWNIVFTIVFLFVNFVGLTLVLNYYGDYGFRVSVLDLFLITFATWRIIRLFVYDNITLFLREFFMDLKIHELEAGDKYEYLESKNSFKATCYKLLMCPWCFGVWTASILTYIYFLIPEFQILFIILSLSAIATFLQIWTNFVGWGAEERKKKVNS